jgi:hypothetical protein
MPNVGAGLKDKEIAYVLTYVRNSFGNHDDPVDEGDVAALRSELGSRAPWTPAEVLQLHPLGAAKPAAAPAAGTATPVAGTPAMDASTAAPNAAPASASATPQAAVAPMAATGN